MAYLFGYCSGALPKVGTEAKNVRYKQHKDTDLYSSFVSIFRIAQSFFAGLVVAFHLPARVPPFL